MKTPEDAKWGWGSHVMTGVPQRFMRNKVCSSVFLGQSLTAGTAANISPMSVYLPPHSAPRKVLQEIDNLKGFYSKRGGFVVLFQVQPLFWEVFESQKMWGESHSEEESGCVDV